MSTENRGKLSRCGRGERLIGSGRSLKVTHDRAKAPGPANAQPNNDDSSIVSLTSSTQSKDKKNCKDKVKVPEPSKGPIKDGNSMLSTDLYPTRDSEAEKVIRAELKNARIPREDQSTDDSAMKPIIVSESNFIAYSKSAPGRLKVRTKSRLKDDRAPRSSRERLAKGVSKPPKEKRHKVKSARGGTGTAISDSPEACSKKDTSIPSPKKSSVGPSKSQGLKTSVDPVPLPTGQTAIAANCGVEVKVETKGPARIAIESPPMKDPPVKGPPPKDDPIQEPRVKEVLRTGPPAKEVLRTGPPAKEVLRTNPPAKEVLRTDPPAKEIPRTDPPAKAAAAKVSPPGPAAAPAADQKSKESIASNKSSNTRPSLCRKCGKAKQRSPDKKSNRRKDRNELINRNVERIKMNMKRAEILSKPATIAYCESSSSFSISSRIELSE